MAFVLADRVEETSATAGTGPLALAGASPGGFRTFGSVMATGDTTRYTYYDPAAGVWETGLGTFTAGTPPTLSRAPAATSAGGTAPVALPGNAAARVFISPDAAHFATFAPRDNPVITGALVVDGANDVRITAAAAGSAPTVATEGADADVSLALVAKGLGTVNVAALRATGGTIDGTPIGNTTPSSGAFTSATVGTGSGAARLFLNGGAAFTRQIVWDSGNSQRWTLSVSGAAGETGANAGSDLSLARFDDAGASLGTPFQVSRASGLVTIGSLSAGTLSATSGALAVGTDAGTSGQITFNAVAGSYRPLLFQSSGVTRWAFACNNQAEAGANAGSDFQIDAHSDAGAYIFSPIYIKRSTGLVTIPNVDLEGGTIDNTAVGNTTPAAGRFTTLAVTGSLTAKFVLAAPNAANGAPAWRQLLASDISGLGTLATANAAAPPALGDTTANTGRFSTLTATGFLLRSMATGLTASTTNTQAGALGLTASVNNITTAAANSAVRLPNAAPAANTAAEIIVRNGGANAMNCFPPSGASINALAANAAFSLAAGATARFMQLSATLYVTA